MHATQRILRMVLATAGVAAIVSVAVPIAATSVGKPLSTGILNTGGSGPTVTTTCFLLNLGSKPITVRSVALLVGSDGTTTSADFDTCSSGPIAAGGGCTFEAGTGVYGGGTAMIKGDLKSVRGNCELINGSGVTVQTVLMR